MYINVNPPHTEGPQNTLMIPDVYAWKTGVYKD